MRYTICRSVIVATILASAALALGAQPAGAHACTNPQPAEPGEPVKVEVGITAEGTEVTAVSVGIPDGFRVDRAEGHGWDADVSDGEVRFTGGTVPTFGCAFVEVFGTPEADGKYIFPLELTTADGETVRYENPEPFLEDSAQLVYSGIELPGLPEAESRTYSVLAIVGFVLVGAGLLALAGWGIWWALRRDAQVPASDGNSHRD